MQILGILLALLITGYGLITGILIVYDPRIGIEKTNALYRLFMGGRPWFQLSAEELKSPIRYWGARAAGLLMTCVCGLAFLDLLSTFAVVYTGDDTMALLPRRRDLDGYRQWPSSAIATQVMLALMGIVGAGFVVFPKRTLAALGMNRWIKDSTPLFVWRMLGAGILVVAAQGLREFLR